MNRPDGLPDLVICKPTYQSGKTAFFRHCTKSFDAKDFQQTVEDDAPRMALTSTFTVHQTCEGGKAGFKQTPAALGWLRVSQRELDAQRSIQEQPVLANDRRIQLSRGEIVPVEIEILPSSTVFGPGETPELSIKGHDQFEHPMMAHAATINKGAHLIHTGGAYDAHLLMPVIPNAENEE